MSAPQLTAKSFLLASDPLLFTHSPSHVLALEGAPGALLELIQVVRGPLPVAYHNQWQAFQALALGTPFQSMKWLGDWQTYIGRPKAAEPITVFCYHEGKLAAVLPLSRQTKWGCAQLNWRGMDVNDYGAPIILSGVAQQLDQSEAIALVTLVANAISGIDLIYLTKQPAIFGSIANPFVFQRSLLHHTSAHRIILGDDWSKYYSSQRSGKSRRRLREKASALQKLGPVTLRFAQNGRQKADLVAQCLGLKIRQIERLGHWNPFHDEAVRSLLTSHALEDKHDTVWAVSLDVDGTAAAVAFGFTGTSGWLLYQMAMTEGQAAQHSPGIHLLQQLMQHCISTGVPSLDLSLGDESYKTDWCNEHLSLMTSLLPLSYKGRIVALVLRTRNALLLRIKRNPMAYDFGQKVKAFRQNVRAKFRNGAEVK